MAIRQEGQIWIDRNAPYNLKYYVNGKEYAIDTAVLYSVKPSKGVEVKKGNLVKITPKGIDLAKFPEDIESVVGICTEDLSSNPDNFSIITSGYIVLSAEEAKSIIKGITDENIAARALRGTPIYWDMGCFVDDSWNDSTAGCLTINTPSKEFTYNNLPLVGIITKNNIHEVELHLNFGRFDSTIEWAWDTAITKDSTIEVNPGVIYGTCDVTTTMGEDKTPVVCGVSIKKSDTKPSDVVLSIKGLVEDKETINVSGVSSLVK